MKGANLLSVDIDARQPTSETRMRMIPSNDHLGPIGRRGSKEISQMLTSERETSSTHLPVCFNISSILVWKT